MEKRDAEQILARLRKSRGRRRGSITWATIADALGVTENTVARWASGRMKPSEDGQLQRLAWLEWQSREWYLKVLPAVVLAWLPGRWPSDLEEEMESGRSLAELEAEQEGAFDVKPGQFFTEIVARPRGEVIEYRLKLASDFVFLTFLAVGPDRNRIVLAHSPDGRGEKKLAFERSAVTKERGISGWDRSHNLRKGSDVAIYVRYLI